MSTFQDYDEAPAAAPPSGVAPPHSIEAEQAVLGAILLSEKLLYSVVIEIGLKPEDFYRERHGTIFGAMLDLYAEGEPIDVLTVTDRLTAKGKLEEVGGKAVVDELAGPVPVVGNLRRYGVIVREQARMRRLLTSTYEIQASVMERTGTPDELIEWAERSILEVAHDDQTKDFSTVGSVLDREVEIWNKLSRDGVTMTGTTSGYRDLDEITGGFQPGNLIVIAARPSMGKSALVTNMAENVSLDKKDPRPVALFSLEMAEAELAQRFIASQSKIEGDKIRKGKLKNEGDFKRVIDAANRFHDAPLFIDDSSDIGTLEIRAKARRLQQQHGQLGLIIVDYLQLMRPDGRVENRVQQVGEMSRGLKILARELMVPVIALSQLSRGVESRTDKRPLLSDLRECVTGDTLVLLADGRRVPIDELVGTTPEVLAIDEHDRIVRAPSDKVWPVGTRPVFDVRLASGRQLRATPDHRIRTGTGWTTIGELQPGDRVALARHVPEPAQPVRWAEDRVVLLGQLIGDGSFLSGQPMRYTTASGANSEAVKNAAEREFGAKVSRYAGQGNRHQLLISRNGNRRKPARVNAWLRELGIFGLRSHEKHIPTEAFRLADDQVATLLRHLWATDGSIHSGPRTDGRHSARVAYSTSSPRLAADVAALLLRLGIVGRTTIGRTAGKCDMHHVLVSGQDAQRRFLATVGAFGPRVEQAQRLTAYLDSVVATTNVDTLPIDVWSEVRAAMTQRGVTTRGMAALRGTSYGGSSHMRFAPSRAVLEDYGTLLETPSLNALARTDLFWDRVISIEPAGEHEVFDLTVPGPACWLADGIVSHNSGQIEQDADLVMFIYRDEYYNPETTETPGEAELIIGKHRNGGLGTINLTFLSKYPKFMSKGHGT